LPLAALFIIKKVRARNGWLYGLHVVDVNTGLKEESLWIHVGLSAAIVVETVVVRTADRQFVLQGIVATADVVNHL
jgi:hypothetical protein